MVLIGVLSAEMGFCCGSCGRIRKAHMKSKGYAATGEVSVLWQTGPVRDGSRRL